MSLTITTAEIVNILKNDSKLVRNWVDFGTRLGLAFDTIRPLRKRFNCGLMSVSELLRTILITWIGRRRIVPTASKLSTILEQMGSQDCADRLMMSTSQSSRITVCVIPAIFGIDKMDHSQGQAQCDNDERMKVADTRNQVLVIGGLGKTEVTTKYISQLSRNFVVTWLSEETEVSFRSLIEQFCNLVQLQTHSTPVLRKENSVGNFNLVRLIVSTNNVDEVGQEFIEVCKTLISFKNSIILLTFRMEEFFLEAMERVELLFLKVRDLDVINYVKMALDSDKSHNYLDEFDRRFRIAVDISVALDMLDGNSNSKTTLTALDEAMEKIKSDLGTPGQLASWMLEVLAFVSPGGIQVEFLKKILAIKCHSDDKTYSDGLTILQMFHLVKCENSGVHLHPLVQKVARNRMARHCELDSLTGWSKTAEFLLKILIGVDTNKVSKEEIIHVLSMWEHFVNQTPITKASSHIPIQISDRLIDLEMLDECHRFAESTSNLLSLSLGVNHRATMVMEHQLACVRHYQGAYTDALRKYKAVYEKQKRILPEGDQDSLTTTRNIASVLVELKRHREALEWGYRVLQSNLKMYGEDSLETVNIRKGIAIILQRQTNYPDAIEKYEQVLQWQVRELGEQHPETLLTRHSICCCLFHQTKCERAELEFQTELESLLEVLGEDHVLTISAKFMLAVTLRRLGKSGKR